MHIFILLISFYLFCVFYAAKIFLKKIWVCPDSLIYYTTDVYPPHPPNGKLFYSNFLFACTYFYLWESLLIHDHLWESFLFCENLFLSMIICENLFFLVRIFFEPFLSVRICSYLWSSMRIFSYSWSSVRIF